MIQSRRAVLGGLASGLALAGCGSGGEPRVAARAKLRGRAAFLVPLSGRSKGLGQAMEAAARLGGPGLGAQAEIEIAELFDEIGAAELDELQNMDDEEADAPAEASDEDVSDDAEAEAEDDDTTS